MKLEMDEPACFTTCIVSTLLVIGLCLMGGCYLTEKTKWKALDAGLVEREGYRVRSVWTKP
jgi:hypothetical protein